MKQVRQFGLILLIFSFFVSSVYAELMVKDYKKLRNSEPTKIYIHGLGNGISFSNAQMHIDTGKWLYCPPDKLGLSRDNFLQILDDEIERAEASFGFQKIQTMYIPILLIHGLRNTFPCDK